MILAASGECEQGNGKASTQNPHARFRTPIELSFQRSSSLRANNHNWQPGPADVNDMQNRSMGYARFMMRCWVAALLVSTAACTKANPDSSCSTGSCPNREFPYCDIEGVISGEPETCIAVTCTPGEVKACLGDGALTCDANGDGYERVPCELGCKSTPVPHCAYIEPRYLPDICDTAAESESFELGSSGVFDPNLDTNCNGGIVPQTGAPGICVLRYEHITIEADAVLRVLGRSETVTPETVGRPVAFVADDDVLIEGTLDISAEGVINGPGGGLVISGEMPKFTGGGMHDAAGGSGGKTAGAAGGSTSADGGGSNGGMAMADPAFLAVLVGGAAAVRGPTEAVTAGGGGGGGVATLVSCRGSVSITGTIDAGGGGGTGGGDFLGAPFPGAAGGAGGYVVLQGKHISVTGSLFANGGAGGAGAQVDLSLGANGADGRPSATDAALGGVAQNGGGAGGNGGVGARVPTVGRKPSMSGAGAGGGGGSVGFFQTYTPDGIEPTLTPAAASPAFQPNGTIKTR